MSVKTVFSILALAIVGSVSVAACAAPTDEATGPEVAESQDEELRLAKYNACKIDNDCVATPTPACCPNGKKSAVNKNKVSAFDADNACKTPPAVCPMFVILDQRVAQCNTGTNKCQMVSAEDIACGGFTRNPHHCPTGYTCDLTGKKPDVPGKCVKNSP